MQRSQINLIHCIYTYASSGAYSSLVVAAVYTPTSTVIHREISWRILRIEACKLGRLSRLKSFYTVEHGDLNFSPTVEGGA